ncbi:snurportin-1 [Vespula pensylvanica]|uniref:Snurportin-1 n=1 Tax=Vespula pensylvanica TaxID=30213 RepID=A0A834NAE7_VESPE|nr:snurportin-1 [Vespula pensylvanica]KAF7400203.1 hypothetical protein H0235_015940 [Vespula pensylvanica]
MSRYMRRGILPFEDKRFDSQLFYKKNIFQLDLDHIDSPQELRRQRYLKIQKRNRDMKYNAGRDIIEIFKSDDEEEKEEEGGEMEFEPSNKSEKRYKRSKHYANQFMLSEWLTEMPWDILGNWFMVVCPEGKRTLLVARKNTTKAFNRRGNRVGKFQSLLPGGNPDEHHSHCTILDCIWIEKKKTYVVLDVLAWSNQSFLNCDTAFRFFWLKSKFEDIAGLKYGGIRNNTYPILLLPHTYFGCSLESIVADVSAIAPLDGILFYHNDALYTQGRTPLVTWLKAFMLPEVLGISLPSPHDKIPDDYIDIKHYLLNFKEKKQKEKAIASTSNMEIVDEDIETI